MEVHIKYLSQTRQSTYGLKLYDSDFNDLDKLVPFRQMAGQTLAFLELLLEPKILVLNLNFE